MAEFTKERIIEELKASTQNASGMFEISEDTICALMSMLTYAAPQLPQPASTSVPDAMEMDDDFDSAFEHGKVVGWNACRAAMLQGAESGKSPTTMKAAPDLDSSPKNDEAPTTIKPVADLYEVTVPSGRSTTFTKDVAEAKDCSDMGWKVQEYVTLERYHAVMHQGAEPDFREISNSSTKHFRENAETSTNCPHCGRKPLKNRKCSVAGCEGRHVAHGFCQKHYDIEHKNNLSRRKNIRAANKRYRAKKSAAPQQEADNG